MNHLKDILPERMQVDERTGKVALALLGLWGAKTAISKIRFKLLQRKVNKARSEYQEMCRDMISDLEDHVQQSKMSAAEVESIASYDFETLLSKLQKGELKPSKVLLAYQTKALEVHTKTNCLIHPLPEAIEIAKGLDAATDRNKPLFGIPVSIKDDQALKGYASALGCVLLLDEMEDDGHIVKILKEQGAVPFVKTNVPTLAFGHQSNNPLNGETSNPLDLRRTPGGSSGGEGALIAGGGSILGIGSDIGGSLRAPAHFNGLCTIKPTSERMTHKDNPHSNEKSGQNRLLGSEGPLARDVQTVVAAMRILYNKEVFKHDMMAAPIPFRDELYEEKRPLRIGYSFNDAIFPVTPACKRAVLVAKAALEAEGHEVVEWTPPDALEGRRIFIQDVNADNAESSYVLLHGDIVDWTLTGFLDFLQGSESWWKKVKIYLMSKWDKKRAEFMRISFGIDSVLQYWESLAIANVWKRRVESSFREARLDVFLCPAFPTIAPFKGEQSEWQMKYSAPHNYIWNTLNVPVGVLPVTRVNDDDVANLEDYTGPDFPKHMMDNVKMEMSTGVGMPVGVQIGAMRYEDETVLRTMMVIQERLKHM